MLYTPTAAPSWTSSQNSYMSVLINKDKEPITTRTMVMKTIEHSLSTSEAIMDILFSTLLSSIYFRLLEQSWSYEQLKQPTWQKTFEGDLKDNSDNPHATVISSYPCSPASSLRNDVCVCGNLLAAQPKQPILISNCLPPSASNTGEPDNVRIVCIAPMQTTHTHTQTHSQHRTWKIHVKVINEFTLQHQHHSYTAECMGLHSKPGQFGGENGFTSRVIIRKMGVGKGGPVRKGMRVLEGFTAHRAVSIHYVERARAAAWSGGMHIKEKCLQIVCRSPSSGCTHPLNFIPTRIGDIEFALWLLI